MLRRITALPPPVWGALLAAAAVLAYWPALHGGLLWDDPAHVTAPALRSVRGLGRIWVELGATQQYYPVLHSFFWLEHRLWGDAVLGYHLTNLALHLLAAGLFYCALRQLRLRWSLWAAALLALHPVAVESVAWISEEKNTLSLVFYLAAALAYGRFDRNRRVGAYALALGLYLLALLSKSVTATLPAAWLVVIWWQRGRLSWARDVRPLAPWLVLGAGVGGFTAWVEHAVVGAQGADYHLTAIMRVLLASRAIWFYLGKLLWPAHLAFIYPHWTIDPGAAWQWLFPVGCAAALAGLLVAAVSRRQRGPLATGLLFAGTLFPALGFVNLYPFAYSYVADHFQYHADLAIFAAAAALGASWQNSAWTLARPGRGWVPVGAAGAILVVLAIQTHRQSFTYTDLETLYRETLRRNPECAMADNNLGVLLARTGRSAEAVEHYRHALAIKPDYAEAENNLGDELALMPGQAAEAVRHFEAAIRLRPDYYVAHDNLANQLAVMPGRGPDAEREFAAALRLRPDYAKAENDWAIELIKQPGREAEALRHYETAVRVRPDYAEAHNNLAIADANAGRLAEAEQQFRLALKYRPDFPEAQENLRRLLGY